VWPSSVSSGWMCHQSTTFSLLPLSLPQAAVPSSSPAAATATAARRLIDLRLMNRPFHETGHVPGLVSVDITFRKFQWLVADSFGNAGHITVGFRLGQRPVVDLLSALRTRPAGPGRNRHRPPR